MSLDVTIKYKQPKKVKYNDTHTACGSTMALVDKDYEETVSEWSANITHNMAEMADHVSVWCQPRNSDGCVATTTLYNVVWRPDECNLDNTSVILGALADGIHQMVRHRKDLLQYNPKNGWGDYDSFLQWLIKYKNECEDNPDCEITVWR